MLKVKKETFFSITESAPTLTFYYRKIVWTTHIRDMKIVSLSYIELGLDVYFKAVVLTQPVSKTKICVIDVVCPNSISLAESRDSNCF